MYSHSYSTSVLTWRSLPFRRALGCLESTVFVLSAKKSAAPSLLVTASSHLVEAQAPHTSLIRMNKWRISYSVFTTSVWLKEHKHKLCHRRYMLHTRTINHTIYLSTDNSPRQQRRSTTTLQQAYNLTAMDIRLKQWVTSSIPTLPPHIFSAHSSQHLVPTSGHLRMPVLTMTTHHRLKGLFRLFRSWSLLHRQLVRAGQWHTFRLANPCTFISTLHVSVRLDDCSISSPRVLHGSIFFECNVSSHALDNRVQIWAGIPVELRAYWLLLRLSFCYCCKSSFMDQGMRRTTLPMFDFDHVANNNSARSQLPSSPHGLLPGQVILPSHLLRSFNHGGRAGFARGGQHLRIQRAIF